MPRYARADPNIRRLLRRLAGLVLVALAAAWLSGCAAAAVGAAALTTNDMLQDRRTVGAYIDDSAVEAKLRQRIYSDANIRRDGHINVASLNGVVLLTGEVTRSELRDRVLAYAREFPEVRQTVNEIRVAAPSGVASRANDSWLKARVRTRLVRDPGIDANRVRVVVEAGTVFLMGLVSQAEGEAAAESARHVPGVERVVKAFEYGS